MKTFLILTTFAAALLACTAQPPTGTATSEIYPGVAALETFASGATDDWTPSACGENYSICLVAGDSGGSTLTGIDSTKWSYGDAFWLKNAGSYPIVLAHDAGSMASNRLFLPDSHDVVLAAGRGVMFYPVWSGGVAAGFSTVDTNGFLAVVSTAAPTRAIGTAFQPSTSRTIDGHWSVRVAYSTTVLTGSQGRVELRSDSSNPPTTVRGRCAGGTGAGLSLAGVVECELTYLVPPADYVRLVSVDEAGTPTYSVTVSSEQVM